MENKKPFKLLIITLLLLPIFSQAQSDFRDGFIIKLNGDSIIGKIDYQSNKKNYQECKFKLNGKLTVYKASEISKFGFRNNKCYTSHILGDAFVEILVEGKMSIFKQGKSYFVEKNKQELFRLEPGDKSIELIAKLERVHHTHWKGIMNYLMSDCPSMPIVAKNLTLNDRNMTTLAIKYNECVQSELKVYKENIPYTKLKVGLSTGISNSTIKVVKHTDMDKFMKDKYSSLNPYAGISFIFSTPRISDNTSLHTELIYSYSSYSSYLSYIYEGRSDNYELSFNLKTLSVPIFFEFKAPVNFVKLNFLLGINNDFQLNSDSHLFREQIYGELVYTNEKEAFTINKGIAGLLVGVNLQIPFKHINLDINGRVMRMKKFDTSSSFESELAKFNLGIIVSSK